ncbi:FAD-dependent oxidoreductase [Ideonella sp. BN130291]|uniref:FAD-dependent oxidoreductase n=1 Tax=Ideonella sp. BN130291 TaxID=3112940 RepID=UPI002E274F48|nr:FAD-dependent oxidoreductase [Ideonella sp. BN130291]
MRVAVIGAGIIGVTTAYELSSDGHEVTVFERRGSVGAETSFANAGLVAPGYVTPWAAPGMPAKVLRHLFSRHAPVRLGGWPDAALLRWVWRWWRACNPASYELNRGRMFRLARYSQDRLRGLTEALQLDYEQAKGCLVLLRTERDLALAEPGLRLLENLQVPFALADAAACYRIEPGLNAETPLHAAIHLPEDEVGNCRQFAHLLKAEAQRLGAQFEFHRRVLAIEPGHSVTLRHQATASHAASTLVDSSASTSPASTESDSDPVDERFDAVVVCAALDSVSLLRPLGVELPLAPVHGYSITAPLRQREIELRLGPRAALMDERYKVAISRLGQRLRVAGSAELGGSLQQQSDAAFATLYRVLHDWFPGAAQVGRAQRWKGARPMLPDGPPVLGPSGAPGVWLNLGHGSSGWALSCGSARLLADRIAGRAPAVDTEGLGIERLR